MIKLDASDLVEKLGILDKQILSAVPLAHQAMAEDLIATIRDVARNNRDFPKEATGRFLGGLGSKTRTTLGKSTTVVESSDRDSKFIDRTTGAEYVVNPGQFETEDLLNPITKWARDKGVNLYSGAKSVGAPSVSRYSALDSDQKFPIFAIARSIAREGIKNTEIFIEALRLQEVSFAAKLEDEINKAIR